MADQDGLWASFNTFISGDPGLADNRGKIVPRNASREPWYHGLDMRIAQDLPVPVLNGHRLQLTSTSSTSSTCSITIGANPTTSATRTTFPGRSKAPTTASTRPRASMRIQWTDRANRYSLSQLGSRWQIQVGVRYSFN